MLHGKLANIEGSFFTGTIIPTLSGFGFTGNFWVFFDPIRMLTRAKNPSIPSEKIENARSAKKVHEL